MPIEIIIKNDEGGTQQNGVQSPDNPVQSNENQDVAGQKVSGKLNAGSMAMINFAKSQAKTWINLGIQSYTKYTGQATLQQQLDGAVNMASDVMGVVTAFAVHPILGGVAVAGIIAREGINEFNRHMEDKTNARSLSFIRQGLGTREVNGGRYGA